MKCLNYYIVTLIVFSHMIFPDGPPIRDNNMTVSNEKLLLDEQQINDAGISRIIKLNNQQVKYIKSKYNITNVKDKYYLITSPYNNCACGLYSYGLWQKYNIAQIPSFYFMNNKSSAADPVGDLLDDGIINKLNMDINGNIYYNGVIVNNFQLLLSKLSKTNIKSVFVNTPPLEHFDIINKVYNNLKIYLNSKGYEVYSYIDENNTNINKISGALTVHSVHEDANLSNYYGLFRNIWKLSATSTGNWKGINYSVSNLIDCDTNSVWVEGVPGNGIGESIDYIMMQDSNIKINKIIINNGFQQNTELYYANSRPRRILVYINNNIKYQIEIKDRQDLQSITVKTIELKKYDKLSFVIKDVYEGKKYQDVSISTLIPIWEE